jgi:hypothetical protein
MTDLQSLKERAEAAKLPCEWEAVEVFGSDDPSEPHETEDVLHIDFPNGRARRRVSIEADIAPNMSSIDFENWTFLGRYRAVWNKQDGTIEAIAAPATGNSILPVKSMLRNLFAKDVITGELQQWDDTPSKSWRLPLAPATDRDSVSVHLGTATPALVIASFHGLRPKQSRLSLTISDCGVSTHDDALRLLETVSAAVFFELDLLYDIPLMLDASSQRRKRLLIRKSQQDARQLKLPKSRYSEDAVSLYSYARSAQAMPLLQFLAYYQVAEFYFRQFTQGEVIQRIKQALRDPQFDLDNDRDVTRLVSLTAGVSGKPFFSELEQLTTTISGCTDESSLRIFLESRPGMLEAMSGKSTIQGVQLLNTNNRNERIIDQVARRIYDIRCRIVHTKEDGGRAAQPMLLPFGEEAYALHFDIDLMRFIAQRVLIARAVTAPWTRS